MKKFALLLLFALPIVFFTACGDEDEPKPYFNPVEGEWVYTSPMKNTETRIFTKEFEALVILNNDGKIINDPLGNYIINETTIRYKNKVTIYTYTIENDTLHLKNTSTDWENKYIRKK